MGFLRDVWEAAMFAAKAILATFFSRRSTASRLAGNCLKCSAKCRTASAWALSSNSVGRRSSNRLLIMASLGFQEFQQFGARDQQLAAQCPAHFEFTTLDEPGNAEIIHAQQGGGFLNGIGEPLGGRGGGLFFGFGDGFHTSPFNSVIAVTMSGSMKVAAATGRVSHCGCVEESSLESVGLNQIGDTERPWAHPGRRPARLLGNRGHRPCRLRSWKRRCGKCPSRTAAIGWPVAPATNGAGSETC